MIVHEEFRIDLHAPNGGHCDFCDAQAEHGLFIHDDHEQMVFAHGDLCNMHTMWFVMLAITKGCNAVRGL